MSDMYVINGSTLTAIADSIRAKTGSTEMLSPSAMPAAIEGISGGGGTSTDERVKYVTFMNGDTVLFKYPVLSGDNCPDPVENGHIETPTKESTAQYNYTHSGWSLTDGGSANSSALSNVTEDRTVWAAFKETVRTYTISFYNGETELKTEVLEYGATPTCDVPDAEVGYVFDGWLPSIAPVTGDAVYTIVWAETTALATGVCGDNLTWQFYENGDFVVTGSGAMTDYDSAADVPWHEYRADIKKISLPDGITTIGNQAFRTTAITSIDLPSYLTKIGKNAFYGCAALTTVNNADAGEIYDYAFQNCSALTTITFGYSSPRTIYSYAFANCTSLESISIPAQVVKWRVFQGCTNLKRVTFQSQYHHMIGDNCFLDCPLTYAYLTNSTYSNTYKWYAVTSETSTSTTTPISGWNNTETAATLLTSTYVGKWWRRTKNGSWQT